LNPPGLTRPNLSRFLGRKILMHLDSITNPVFVNNLERVYARELCNENKLSLAISKGLCEIGHTGPFFIPKSIDKL
jgi:hypothetical protein